MHKLSAKRLDLLVAPPQPSHLDVVGVSVLANCVHACVWVNYTVLIHKFTLL